MKRIQLTALLLLFSTGLPGQVTSSSIAGFVFDPSGKVVRGAVVTASSPSRSIHRSALTDANGFYTLPDLAPAVYTLEATALSFGISHLGEVPLAVDSRLRVDFHLQLAAAKATITVQAESLPRDSTDLGGVIDQLRIEALPLNERDFLQLAMLTPGVLPPVQNSELSTRGTFAMQANGAREDANNYLLDGVDNNDFEVHRYVLEPSVDAIQEFKIAVNNYSAEYGRSAGGQVNVITRAGSNSWQGFGYEYLRNRDFDARNFFDGSSKAEYNRNQFGGGIGGPVRHNRTFLFVNADALREKEGLTQLGTVPTAAMRSGNLAGTGATVADPFSGAPFPGNVIPASRIDPLAGRLLSLFPLPTSPGISGNFLGQPVQPTSDSQFSVRLDHRFSEKNQLAVRYSYLNTHINEPFAQNSTEVPGFGDVVQESGHNAMIQDVHLFGPHAVNTVLIGFNRAIRELLQTNHQTNVNQLWGVNWLPTDPIDFGYPQINVSGFSQVGDVTELPINRAENTYQLTDGFSLVHGSHTLKAGFEMRRQQHNGIDDIYSRGALSFLGALSGSGIGDLLLGLPTFGIQSQFDNAQTLRSTDTDAYFQDDWKVSRSLTLNLGLRYEYNAPATDPFNRMSDFLPATGQIVNVGTNGVTLSGYHADYKDFAPRLGFAWSPDSRLVVRGGYGIFYDASMSEISTALYFNPPYFTVSVFTPTATSLLTLANPFPRGGGFVPAPTLSALDPNLTSAYLQSWNLNVQRQFSAGVLSVAYAASKGTHLTSSRDINQPPPGPGDLTTRQPYPAYSNIFYTGTGANSEFQSLQLSFNRPLSHGLSLLGVYSFSKSMDDASAFLGTSSDPNFPQNSRDYGAEHARSSFDTPQRAEVALVWRVPGRSAWIRNLEVSSIVTAQSGQPFTPILSTDNSNTGNIGGQEAGSDRPNVVGNPAIANPGASEWFNTAAFAEPAPYTFGNAGRNILRGPGTFTTDFSLLRRFHLRERASLAVQAEAFNLFNRVNFNLPELYADQPTTFGKIFSAKDPRQIQLALRLAF